jgi:hypothetical protein
VITSRFHRLAKYARIYETTTKIPQKDIKKICKKIYGIMFLQEPKNIQSVHWHVTAAIAVQQQT